MTYRYLEIDKGQDRAYITMNRPEKRNALSLGHMKELIAAFTEIGDSEVAGVILKANGPVFSAGHDFSDMAGQDLTYMRKLLRTCTELMILVGEIPQVVVAQVHALATAAGAQLVASCDLAVASSTAGFAAPGGKGGWFCHTPMVAISHSIGRKRAVEMALTGDVISAATAVDWGLINYAVEPDQLETATEDLLTKATRGSKYSKSFGKEVLYRQMDLPVKQAYELAVEAMAAASQTHDAQEGMSAFLEKRAPKWQHR